VPTLSSVVPRSVLFTGLATVAADAVVLLARPARVVEALVLGLALVAVAAGAVHHERARRALTTLALTDELTRVLNRRGFEARVADELARARRSGGEVGLVLVDLDDFKRVNDTHGHQAGDDLLRWVGATLADDLRAHDAVGRLGGDEFAVLVTGGDTAAACERLRTRLARRAPASAGAAAFPADGADYITLVRAADARLYAGKAEASSARAR
jgi:diguanylate cyclase (GGDEF)-like protein